MTSKPKIHMLVIDDYITDVVTHADYRALEEELYVARLQRDQAEDKLARATEELASIKARVGEGK